ncbi:uncharacterized protein LOC124199581 isoform X2 [Daphnia pulex]|uniref:uncharacterized protein LOC124199581 isoform X2 n=1 Tax=Daphnia pulex TaxID=6669 RepID=UPI001EDD8C0F|nr:uncharacterized protein LOC124199581 isoform X2 [Daphnia pulex]
MASLVEIIIAVCIVSKLTGSLTLTFGLHMLGSTTSNVCLNADDYFSRQFLNLRNDEISYTISIKDSENENSQCFRSRRLLREYKPADVARCFDSLSVKRNRRPMHFAFIGDSTIRQQFNLFLRLIPDYDRKVSRVSNLWVPYLEEHHADCNVTSHLLDNLKVSFYWRNIIQTNLIDDFMRWASADDKSKVPDFILLGVTAHHIDQKNYNTTIINSFQTYQKLLDTYLVPLINQSLNINPHQEIIWLRQSATTMGQFNRGFYPETVKMFNNAVHQSFKDTRVIIWDGINAVVEEYLRACALSREERQNDSEKVDNRYINCQDFIHPGLSALSIGTQFMINHICERGFNI